MFLLWWIGCAYMAGGAAVPCTVINSSIHVLMYRQVTHNMIYTTWRGKLFCSIYLVFYDIYMAILEE